MQGPRENISPVVPLFGVPQRAVRRVAMRVWAQGEGVRKILPEGRNFHCVEGVVGRLQAPVRTGCGGVLRCG